MSDDDDIFWGNSARKKQRNSLLMVIQDDDDDDDDDDNKQQHSMVLQQHRGNDNNIETATQMSIETATQSSVENALRDIDNNNGNNAQTTTNQQEVELVSLMRQTNDLHQQRTMSSSTSPLLPSTDNNSDTATILFTLRNVIDCSVQSLFNERVRQRQLVPQLHDIAYAAQLLVFNMSDIFTILEGLHLRWAIPDNNNGSMMTPWRQIHAVFESDIHDFVAKAHAKWLSVLKSSVTSTTTATTSDKEDDDEEDEDGDDDNNEKVSLPPSVTGVNVYDHIMMDITNAGDERFIHTISECFRREVIGMYILAEQIKLYNTHYIAWLQRFQLEHNTTPRLDVYLGGLLQLSTSDSRFNNMTHASCLEHVCTRFLQISQRMNQLRTFAFSNFACCSRTPHTTSWRNLGNLSEDIYNQANPQSVIAIFLDVARLYLTPSTDPDTAAQMLGVPNLVAAMCRSVTFTKGTLMNEERGRTVQTDGHALLMGLPTYNPSSSTAKSKKGGGYKRKRSRSGDDDNNNNFDQMAENDAEIAATKITTTSAVISAYDTSSTEKYLYLMFVLLVVKMGYKIKFPAKTTQEQIAMDGRVYCSLCVIYTSKMSDLNTVLKSLRDSRSLSGVIQLFGHQQQGDGDHNNGQTVCNPFTNFNEECVDSKTALTTNNNKMIPLTIEAYLGEFTVPFSGHPSVDQRVMDKVYGWIKNNYVRDPMCQPLVVDNYVRSFSDAYFDIGKFLVVFHGHALVPRSIYPSGTPYALTHTPNSLIVPHYLKVHQHFITAVIEAAFDFVRDLHNSGTLNRVHKKTLDDQMLRYNTLMNGGTRLPQELTDNTRRNVRNIDGFIWAHCNQPNSTVSFSSYVLQMEKIYNKCNTTTPPSPQAPNRATSTPAAANDSGNEGGDDDDENETVIGESNEKYYDSKTYIETNVENLRQSAKYTPKALEVFVKYMGPDDMKIRFMQTKIIPILLTWLQKNGSVTEFDKWILHQLGLHRHYYSRMEKQYKQQKTEIQKRHRQSNSTEPIDSVWRRELSEFEPSSQEEATEVLNRLCAYLLITSLLGRHLYSRTDSERHLSCYLHIIGKTGTGKSKFLEAFAQLFPPSEVGHIAAGGDDGKYAFQRFFYALIYLITEQCDNAWVIANFYLAFATELDVVVPRKHLNLPLEGRPPGMPIFATNEFMKFDTEVKEATMEAINRRTVIFEANEDLPSVMFDKSAYEDAYKDSLPQYAVWITTIVSMFHPIFNSHHLRERLVYVRDNNQKYFKSLTGLRKFIEDCLEFGNDYIMKKEDLIHTIRMYGQENSGCTLEYETVKSILEDSHGCEFHANHDIAGYTTTTIKYHYWSFRPSNLQLKDFSLPFVETITPGTRADLWRGVRISDHGTRQVLKVIYDNYQLANTLSAF